MPYPLVISHALHFALHEVTTYFVPVGRMIRYRASWSLAQISVRHQYITSESCSFRTLHHFDSPRCPVNEEEEEKEEG